MIFVPAYPTPIRNLLHNKPPIVVLNSHVIEGQTLNSRCTAGRHRSRPFVLDAKRTFFVAITPRLTSGQPGHPKTNRFVSFLRPSASISNVWHFLYLHFFKRSMNVSQMITEHSKSHFSRLGVAIYRSWCISVIVCRIRGPAGGEQQVKYLPGPFRGHTKFLVLDSRSGWWQLFALHFEPLFTSWYLRKLFSSMITHSIGRLVPCFHWRSRPGHVTSRSRQSIF